MKFKTILSAIALASLPVVVNAEAVVTGENVCGVLKVTSNLKNTIVAVPWVEVDSGDHVKVANLVMTANLTEGDRLFVYESGTWYSYVLEDGAWKPTTTTATAGGISLAEHPGTKALAKGTALFLQRNGSLSEPFYLYGQVKTDAVSTTVTAGTEANPTFTLVASPAATALDLNASGKVTGSVNEKDLIIIPAADGNDVKYSHDGTKWGYWKQTEKVFGGKTKIVTSFVAAPKIPAGTGFWYVSAGGTPTFNW